MNASPCCSSLRSISLSKLPESTTHPTGCRIHPIRFWKPADSSCHHRSPHRTKRHTTLHVTLSPRDAPAVPSPSGCAHTFSAENAPDCRATEPQPRHFARAGEARRNVQALAHEIRTSRTGAPQGPRSAMRPPAPRCAQTA
jgi:hypothetical protein